MTATPLTPAETGRVIALLGMLGSAHDGERATAGAMVTKLLRSRGVQWSDLITPALTYSPRHLPEPEPPGDWRKQAIGCLGYEDRLTEWERSFLFSILYRSKLDLLTAKQLETLDAITANVARRGRP